MNLKISKEACIGCGICQSLCPKDFLIEDGIAKIINTNSRSCDSKEVIESCPCQAISIKTK